MREYREDGTLPGEPTMGRIYKAAHDGVLHLQYSLVEFVTDWPDYIENYDSFRGYVTEFLSKDELTTKLAELKKIGFTSEEKQTEKIAHLKQIVINKHAEAVKAISDYINTAKPAQGSRPLDYHDHLVDLIYLFDPHGGKR